MFCYSGSNTAEPSFPTRRSSDLELPFVVKARHSIFYETQLEYLLRQEEIERIVLTGQVTEQCILYSALDAYVRHFEDRKSTRLNSSHSSTSYAVFCLKKKKPK